MSERWFVQREKGWVAVFNCVPGTTLPDDLRAKIGAEGWEPVSAAEGREARERATGIPNAAHEQMEAELL